MFNVFNNYIDRIGNSINQFDYINQLIDNQISSRTSGSNNNIANDRHIPFTLPPSRRYLQLNDRSGSDARIQHQRSSSSTTHNRQQISTIDIAYHC
jgi:hypothetical protein